MEYVLRLTPWVYRRETGTCCRAPQLLPDRQIQFAANQLVPQSLTQQ